MTSEFHCLFDAVPDARMLAFHYDGSKARD